MGMHVTLLAMGCGGAKDKRASAVTRREFQAEEPTGPDLRPECSHVWYWEEDTDRVHSHHTWDKQGNYVAYPPRVSEYIESQYLAWSSGEGVKQQSALEISYKCFAERSGFNYSVDFAALQQVNSETGFKRKILRRQNPNYVAPEQTSAPISKPEGDLPPPPVTLFSALRHITFSEFIKIIDQGPMDLNAQSPAGGTLLTWAAEYHRVDIVQALLDRGVDARSESNSTVLEWASTPSYPDESKDRTAVLVDRDATIALLQRAIG